MENKTVKTLRQFLEEIGSYSYDNGDYGVIKDTVKEKEVQKFVEEYIPGTHILKNGKDGTAIAIQGKFNEKDKATGAEELFFHDYQLYDLSAQTGEWLVVTFKTKEELEKHILSEGGFLNLYCTEMIVFENGIIKPFEILFAGDNDITVTIDKDRFDTGLDVKAIQDRISVKWL